MKNSPRKKEPRGICSLGITYHTQFLNYDNMIWFNMDQNEKLQTQRG